MLKNTNFLTARYPEVELESTTLSFCSPGINTSKYALQWFDKGSAESYSFFTIVHEKQKKIVGIDRAELMTRFHVSEQLVQRAELVDTLMSVIRYELLKNNELLEEKNKDRLEQLLRKDSTNNRGYTFRFSAKDYNLPQAIFLTRSQLFFSEKQCIFDNGSTKIKLAKTRDGGLVARRVQSIQTLKENCRATDTIKTLRKLQGLPGIIDLQGEFQYITSTGKEKIATYHSLFQCDLLTFLSTYSVSDKSLIRSLCLGYASQLLTALKALPGAHGDLKPDNILLNGERLVLTDFEYYRPPEKSGPHGAGTIGWNAPETFQQEVDIDCKKLDVWGAGQILYYLFCYPNVPSLPWHGPSIELKFSNDFMEKTLAERLSSPQLSYYKKILLSHMLIISPAERWSIDEAETYFHTYIASNDLPLEEATPRQNQKETALSCTIL